MTPSENQPSQQNITEAYKAVIDFNKVVISISSAVLAAVITFLVSQDFPLIWSNIVSPILLIGSFIFCLMGFGHSISAIQKNESRKIAKRFSNIGGYLMLAGIISIILLKKEEVRRIDEILKLIQKTSAMLQYKLLTTNCDSIALNENIYTFEYKIGDSINVRVDYSLDKNKIILLNKTAIAKPVQ